MDNDFKVLLQAVLDSSNIGKTDIDAVQKVLNKYHLNLTADLSKAELLKSIKTIVPQLEKELKRITGIDIQITDSSILKSIAQIDKEMDSVASKASKIKDAFNTGTYSSKVDSLIAKTAQWTDVNGVARTNTDALRQSLTNLGNAYNTLNADGGNTIANQQALISAEQALDAEIKKVQNSVNSLNTSMMKDSAIASLRQQVQKFYDINTASRGKWGSELKNIIDSLAPGMQVTTEQGRKLAQEFINIQNAARQAGKLGKSFIDTIKSGMQSFSYWTSSTFLVMKGLQAFKDGVKFAREFDEALTNINYTMSVSESQLDKVGKLSLNTSKELKTSASNVLDAVKTYANAMETADTILNKAHPTIMLSNVSGMNTQETVDILQGTMEQFDLAEDQLMHISDVLQTVSANMPYDFAKGLRELSEGIQASGETARQSGYDLERYTSLLGVLISQTRQSGSELGRALRTMMLRTTKASTSALANGEVTEDDLSNAEKALRRVGIEVRSDVDTFKDFDQVIGELYDKLETLSDVDMSNLAYELAGIRQANVFKMMVSAYGDYTDMADKAYDATGKTLENQEKYAASLDGQLKGLGTTVTSIGHNLINEGELKVVVSGFTRIAELIDSITSKTKLFGTIGIGAGLFAGIQNIGKCVQAYDFKKSCFECALHA